MAGISETELDDFCDKLRAFRSSLPPEQAELLDAICLAARDISATREVLGDEFDGCFTPDEAGLLLAYGAGEARMIRGTMSTMLRGDGMIQGSPVSMIRGLVSDSLTQP